jgi:hypothetical protein
MAEPHRRQFGRERITQPQQHPRTDLQMFIVKRIERHIGEYHCAALDIDLSEYADATNRSREGLLVQVAGFQLLAPLVVLVAPGLKCGPMPTLLSANEA